MIKAFRTGEGFPFHCLEIMCPILLTLPALENVAFDHIAGHKVQRRDNLSKAWSSFYNHLLDERSRIRICQFHKHPFPKLYVARHWKKGLK
jgi:hypothetical protein